MYIQGLAFQEIKTGIFLHILIRQADVVSVVIPRLSARYHWKGNKITSKLLGTQQWKMTDGKIAHSKLFQPPVKKLPFSAIIRNRSQISFQWVTNKIYSISP